MFDEITPQDFAFKVRDVLNKNSINLHGQQRYDADFYAMQRVHAYLKQHRCSSNLRAARQIRRALAIVTPYNSHTVVQMETLADSMFNCYDRIIQDYIQSSIDEHDVEHRIASDMWDSLENFIKTTNKDGSVGPDEPQRSASTTEPDDYNSEEEDDEYDGNEYSIPVATMSLTLRQALGLKDVMNEDDEIRSMAAKSNWRAPDRHGLSNSSAIISTSAGEGTINSSASLQSTHAPSQRASLQSGTAPQSEMLNSDKDVEEDDDDESDYDFDDNDDGEVPSGAMSVNLMKALGMDTTGMEVETDWKPPERSGLEHSKPIFSANTRKEGNSRNISRHQSEDDDESDSDFDDNDDGEVPSGAMSVNLMKALGMDTTGMEVETDWKPPERSGLEHSNAIFTVSGRKERKSPYISKHQSEDNGQSEYVSDEDDGEIPSGAMSVNLMKALGMDTTGMEVETDWKPPELSGLEHSKPIFTTDKMKVKSIESSFSGSKLSTDDVQRVLHQPHVVIKSKHERGNSRSPSPRSSRCSSPRSKSSGSGELHQTSLPKITPPSGTKVGTIIYNNSKAPGSDHTTKEFQLPDRTPYRAKSPIHTDLSVAVESLAKKQRGTHSQSPSPRARKHVIG